MKVLNLYAGIGGNRKLWDNVEVTAVEKHNKIAKLYQKLNPNDTIIIGDAIDYLIKNYRGFDFIWCSPPCQTHSMMRFMASKKGDYEPKLPDLSLYSIILFLKHFCESKWVVENVNPYYDPLIKPSIQLGRHIFWSNFHIPFKEFKSPDVGIKKVTSKTNRFKFTLENISLGHRKDQILRNCVDPKIGKYILDCSKDKVTTLETFTTSDFLACNKQSEIS